MFRLKGRGDAIHLWTKCSATRGLVNLQWGPIDAWSLIQLSRFLREPLIAGLIDGTKNGWTEDVP